MSTHQPAYRVYLIGKDGHIYKAIPLPSCTDDDEARAVAKSYVDGCGVEIWNRANKLGAYPSVD